MQSVSRAGANLPPAHIRTPVLTGRTGQYRPHAVKNNLGRCDAHLNASTAPKGRRRDARVPCVVPRNLAGVCQPHPAALDLIAGAQGGHGGEHTFTVFFRDARSVVSNADRNPPCPGVGADQDLPLRQVMMLDRIGKQGM